MMYDFPPFFDFFFQLKPIITALCIFARVGVTMGLMDVDGNHLKSMMNQGIDSSSISLCRVHYSGHRRGPAGEYE